jgi:hypothetical protein
MVLRPTTMWYRFKAKCDRDWNSSIFVVVLQPMFKGGFFPFFTPLQVGSHIDSLELHPMFGSLSSLT